jgi:hypothetical protein
LGGGLFNSGATTIVDCTFSNNVAADMLPFYGIGGAINHDGTKLQITAQLSSGTRPARQEERSVVVSAL